MAYQDFSAAYFQKPSKYVLIYESNAFNACSDWFTFSTAAEAKQPDGITVTFDPATGSYDTRQDLGQFGIFKTRMTVKDGLIVSAQNLADKKSKVVTRSLVLSRSITRRPTRLRSFCRPTSL